MKLRARQIVLLTIAVVVLAAGLGVLGYYWLAKRAVADYRKQLIAAGEKLSVAELIPPPPLDEENGADIIYKVQTLMNVPNTLLETNPPTAMLSIAPGKAMVRWQQPDIRDPKTTNTWDEVDSAMPQISDGIEILDRLADKRMIDFKLNYNQGFNLLVPMLSKVKQAAQQLSVATVLSLHNGDADSAATHLRAMLGLARGSANERLAISQLVRFAIAAIAFNATWEFLQSTNATDAQLAAIQRDWSQMDFIRPTEFALEMERAMSETMIGDMRASSAEFHKMTTAFVWPGGGGGGGGSAGSSGNLLDRAEQLARDSWEKTKEASKEAAWRMAWSYPDQLRMLKGKQVLIESLRQAGSNGNFNVAIQMQEARLKALSFFEDNGKADDTGNLFGDGHDLQFLFSQGVESLNGVIRKAMIAETSRQLATTAIALKRFRLRYGNFPPDLAALSPQFLPTTPHDPVNAQPLHYKSNSDGTFLLYSVGDDAEDNGGDPSPIEPDKFKSSWNRGHRDWVWPQPANEKEIQDHFGRKSRE